MKEFIEYLVKQIVDKPEEVEVIEVSRERTIVCELRVAEGELGKVIGKKGRTANAIRTIITAASAKQNKRVILEILES